MSATIAQLRFNATLPKKTNKYANVVLADTTSIEAANIGALMIKPTAQMIGSARGDVFFNRCAMNVPNGTPIMPDAIVIAPNRNDTLRMIQKIIETKYKKLIRNKLYSVNVDGLDVLGLCYV